MTANQINYWNLQETKRHNVTTEGETERHNRATEGIDLGRLEETRRHNVASEGIEQGKLDLGYAQLGKDYAVLAEQNRHNLATEQNAAVDLNIKQQTQTEQERYNKELNRQGAVIGQSQALANQMRALRDEAETKLTDVQRTWLGIKESQNIELTNKNIAAVSQQLKKVEADIQRAQTLNTIDAWKAANDSVNAAARIIDAFIPG